MKSYRDTFYIASISQQKIYLIVVVDVSFPIKNLCFPSEIC